MSQSNIIQYECTLLTNDHAAMVLIELFKLKLTKTELLTRLLQSVQIKYLNNMYVREA